MAAHYSRQAEDALPDPAGELGGMTQGVNWRSCLSEALVPPQTTDKPAFKIIWDFRISKDFMALIHDNQDVRESTAIPESPAESASETSIVCITVFVILCTWAPSLYRSVLGLFGGHTC